jgi:hypothetical protein
MTQQEWQQFRDRQTRELLKLGYKTKDIQNRLAIDINLINKIRRGEKPRRKNLS